MLKDLGKIIILGSGPTGLGAAYRLKELGYSNFVLIEKENASGGLASSFVDEKGFTWDIGGHVQFSHYDYFDEVMNKALGPDGYYHHEREAWVWMENRFIPYPFQYNIQYLPPEKMWQCINALLHLPKNATTPQNFKEWILQSFGEGLAEVFMFPYNYKVWAYPAEQMAYHWIGERVAVTNLERVIKNIIFQKADVSWGPNNTFKFPKKGGTGAIWKAVADLIGKDFFSFETEMLSVDPEKKLMTVKNSKSISSEIKYSIMLNTIPLDQLAYKIKGLDPEIKKTAAGLKHSQTNIVGIGLKGKAPQELAKKCWMYFPEENCPFYRVTVFSNYSPAHVPDSQKYWSLMTETSASSHKKINAENLVEETIQGLLNTKLIESRDQIESIWSYQTEYGYPTPSLERDSILEKVIPHLDSKNIFSRGRFGGWKYEASNQDHAFMQGVEWANKLFNNEEETTYFNPNKANSMIFKKNHAAR
jgi:protoporphyrinogen oxidase